MAIELKSGASSDILTVDATSKAARATLYDTAGNVLSIIDKSAIPTGGQGGIAAMGKNDDTNRQVRVDRIGNMGQAAPIILLSEDLATNATLHPGRWVSAVTTQTVTQTHAGGILLNASAITTTGTGSGIASARVFPRSYGQPITFAARIRHTLVSNQVAEWGFVDVNPGATTAQIGNGAFWRFTGGTVIPQLAFNGADGASGSDISGSLNSANYYNYEVILKDDRAIFICQRTDTGAIVSEQILRLPITQQRIVLQRMVVMMRLRHASAPASAGQMMITDCLVTAIDLNGMPFSQQLAGDFRSSLYVPLTGLLAANYANSAAPSSATLSNTTAGYTTLGGQFQFAAVAGAETDYSLFAFTMSAQPAPMAFVCTGIQIHAFNMGAAVATTPTLLQWGLAVNNVSANISTATNRKVLGAMSFAVGAAVGAVASNPIVASFPDGLVTLGTNTFCVILKMPVGTATASQIIRGTVDVEGYFV